MWNKIANDKTIGKTAEALKENGIEAIIVQDGNAAKEKVLQFIPKGAQVMVMSSETLIAIGLDKEIDESGNYDSVRNKLNSMNRETQGREMQMLGAAPEWAIGSAHAVSENGEVLVASNTGSQLPAYAYGSDHVIWVIGAQKIVKDTNAGIKRIYDYVLPLESKRVQKAYGMPHSNVSKLLIFNKELRPGRITAILVKEVLGF